MNNLKKDMFGCYSHTYKNNTQIKTKLEVESKQLKKGWHRKYSDLTHLQACNKQTPRNKDTPKKKEVPRLDLTHFQV